MLDEDFGDQIVSAYKRIGFVIVKNHGISKELIDQVFGAGREIFQLNSEQKMAHKYNSDVSRGYNGIGIEILDEVNKKN